AGDVALGLDADFAGDAAAHLERARDRLGGDHTRRADISPDGQVGDASGAADDDRAVEAAVDRHGRGDVAGDVDAAAVVAADADRPDAPLRPVPLDEPQHVMPLAIGFITDFHDPAVRELEDARGLERPVDDEAADHARPGDLAARRVVLGQDAD